jgi:hypothetical protein
VIHGRSACSSSLLLSRVATCQRLLLPVASQGMSRTFMGLILAYTAVLFVFRSRGLHLDSTVDVISVQRFCSTVMEDLVLYWIRSGHPRVATLGRVRVSFAPRPQHEIAHHLPTDRVNSS